MVKAQRLKVGERVTAADDKMRIAFFIVVMLFFLLDYLIQSVIALTPSVIAMTIVIPTIARHTPITIARRAARASKRDSVAYFIYVVLLVGGERIVYFGGSCQHFF